MKIKFKHRDLYYEVSGKGTPWVFLHGFLESSTMWNHIESEFSKLHTIIKIDLPGHGQSQCISDAHSMELLAEAVRSILSYLSISKATFIGHSMGGYVALAYAELFPSEVTSLVLVNSTPAEDSPERKANRTRALAIIEQDPSSFIHLAIASLFLDKTRSRYAMEIQQLQKEALQFPIEGIIAAIKGMKDRKDRTIQLKRFKKKKYIICGEEDPIISYSVAEIVAKFCEVKLISVSGGHMSTIENTEEICKILHFIE